MLRELKEVLQGSKAHLTMIDLLLSGLPLYWDKEGKRLLFTEALQEVEPSVRYLKDMKKVLYAGGKKAFEEPWRELYFMYRDLHLVQHEELFAEKRLRYDVTVILPGTVGEEYNKTAGHYHPVIKGAGVTYPELYEVLHGHAHYLLQKPYNLYNSHESLREVIIIDAHPGEKVLIPPGFGHITINPYPEPLIMSNLVAKDFSSVYEPILIMGGAGYYELASTSEQGPCLVPNPAYSSLPQIKFCRAAEHDAFPLMKEKPLYIVFIEDQNAFSFLTAPEQYSEEFNDYIQRLVKS